MTASPQGSHNHSQTHLKLSNRLLLQALVSTDLHIAKSLKTWTFLSLETLGMQKLLVISGLVRLSRLADELKWCA